MGSPFRLIENVLSLHAVDGRLNDNCIRKDDTKAVVKDYICFVVFFLFERNSALSVSNCYDDYHRFIIPSACLFRSIPGNLPRHFQPDRASFECVQFAFLYFEPDKCGANPHNTSQLQPNTGRIISYFTSKCDFFLPNNFTRN